MLKNDLRSALKALHNESRAPDAPNESHKDMQDE
jgi:hypothetical protein